MCPGPAAHHCSFDWLSPADREKIFAGNARKLFKLKV
jgi:predicted TIM-barrel fold metal-dependent hydrolase